MLCKRAGRQRSKPRARKVAFPGHVLGLNQHPEAKPARVLGCDAVKQDTRYLRYKMHASGNLISAAPPNSAQLKFPGYAQAAAACACPGQVPATRAVQMPNACAPPAQR